MNKTRCRAHSKYVWRVHSRQLSWNTEVVSFGGREVEAPLTQAGLPQTLCFCSAIKTKVPIRFMKQCATLIIWNKHFDTHTYLLLFKVKKWEIHQLLLKSLSLLNSRTLLESQRLRTRLYGTVQDSMVLYKTVWYCTRLYCTVQDCMVLVIYTCCSTSQIHVLVWWCAA